MSALNLLYLSIGSGHQMAARALGEAVQRLAPGRDVEVFDPLARKAGWFPRLANLGLGWTTRYGGSAYDRSWKEGNARWLKWAARQAGLIKDMLNGEVVAATHVFALRMALAHRERFGGIRRIYGVVTDFGLHGYWPLEDVDGYLVGNEDLAAELVRRGLPAGKVTVTGIPLRLDFAAAEPWQPRRAGGPLRVLVLAGGIGSGAYAVDLAWFQALVRALSVSPEEVRITIITGSRTRLLAELQGLAKETRVAMNPRGLVGDMAGVMRSHDLLVAKPGGVTVAEALACGLPLAALRPGPGQETANCAFLRRNQVWLEAFTPDQAAEGIARAVKDEAWLFGMGQRVRRLGKPEAALDAARIVLQEKG